jgi:hypothetical protein
MDFAESLKDAAEGGTGGQPHLNLEKNILISGIKSETRLDLGVQTRESPIGA